MIPFTPWFADVLRDLYGSAEDGADVDGGGVIVTPPADDDDPPAPEPPAPGHVPRYCWAIDAGHGFRTRGKRSPNLGKGVRIRTEQVRLVEYECNWDVSERLIELLSAAGLAYFRTMPVDGDHGNALATRVRNANRYPTELPKRGVSIHSNAGPTDRPEDWTRARGIETWHFHGSPRGKAMAAVFQRHQMRAAKTYAVLHARTRRTDRGIRSRPRSQFYILRATTFPVVLTENLFFNNRSDVHWLLDPAYRQMIAEALFDAIYEIETAPAPAALKKNIPPDTFRAILTLVSGLLTLFSRSPSERWARRRARYLRRLQRLEGRGKIDEATYRRWLADYDLANPPPT